MAMAVSGLGEIQPGMHAYTTYWVLLDELPRLKELGKEVHLNTVTLPLWKRSAWNHHEQGLKMILSMW